ncbi:hypothetical protein, partial [Nocardioides antri]|uniref:hypothetical protein n=1 Tax=Nocardioides antri TaxID=2607659 RepID=UPI001CB7599F
MVSENWDTWLTSWVCGVFAVVLVIVLVALLLKASRGTPIQEFRAKTAELSCSPTCKKWHNLTDVPFNARNKKVPGGDQNEEVKISAPV